MPPMMRCKVCDHPIGLSAIRVEPLCVYCYAWAVRVTATHVALSLMGWDD